MRTAMMAHPNSDLTRQIQDEAAATFDSLFLGGKGDALPPVEALACSTTTANSPRSAAAATR